MSAFALIVGTAFIGIGIFVVIPAFGAIDFLWTLAAVGFVGYHGFSLFSKSGVAHEVVNFEFSISPTSQRNVSKAPELRLAKLDALKAAGAITEMEYKEQKARILREI